MNDNAVAELRAALAALETQRTTLGDPLFERAAAPLRTRLAGLLRPAGLQRRQVTVLFADVVGSAALAQGLDAEPALQVLSGALRRMASVIEAHRGRVLRFTGDGVKAAFGMDEAREDDAEKAVLAGLAILAAGREQAADAQRQHGIADFAVRVGVHTGDVALGAGVEADNTAMGAAVNIAARMEQSAPPGALRISQDTWSLVRGLFDLQAQPPLWVKGIDLPMQTYLVHAALDRSTAQVERGLQGLHTPMVGRDAELQHLLQTVATARQTRQLQAVNVLGDAGLGKSRLLREFTAACAGCRIVALRAQPDGLLRLFGLLRSLLATQFGVADTDSAAQARRKVVDGLLPWLHQRGERQAQLIGQLSGLDFTDSPHLRGLDPRSLRDQAFSALRAYLQALAAQGDTPLVLLVEDLHWADDGSLDLLQHLQAHAATLPLVLVMTARPALLVRRPDWGTPETRLVLSPLAAAQGQTLAQALLQRLDATPAALTGLLVGRAEGNPYYMEELVRRLIDDGVIVVGDAHWQVHADRLDTVRLPTTLVGLLQARLDALPTGDRQAARQASVIGHVFWDDALRALDAGAPLALPALQRAAFVRSHDTSDFEGTVERQFDHHLLHQVTYDTLLKAERKHGHGAAAQWLKARTDGRGSEFLAMTGEHAERAGELALAIDCFDNAASQALQRFANPAALAWLRRALALLEWTDPPRRFDLLDRLQTILDTQGDRAGQDAAHEEMARLLDSHPDALRQARLCYRLALLAERRSDTETSERLSLQAFALAEGCGAADIAASAQGNRAWLRLARQDHQAAMAPLALGLQWARKIDDTDARTLTEARLLMLSAIISVVLCQFDDARRDLQALLVRGEALASPRLQLGALDNLAMVASYLGWWDQAIGYGEQMRPLAEATGAAPDLAGAQLRIAQAAGSKGDHALAMRLHEDNLVILRTTGNRRQQACTLRFLGASHSALGDTASALQWHKQAQAVYETLEEPLEECENLADLARCLFGLGQAQEALVLVSSVLSRLEGELAATPAYQTIELRWPCQQVLEALGDPRATHLLYRLHADVLARTAELTGPADRDRLVQALPVFRGIVAAGQRLGDPARHDGQAR